MEERIDEADLLLGVFSDAYCEALFSRSERWAAYWHDADGRKGFLVPIEVKKVSKWPAFVNPLRRLSLVDLSEEEAARNLIAFLQAPTPPSAKPIFPGGAPVTSSSVAFTEGSEPVAGEPPVFPAALKKPEPIRDTTIRCINEHEPEPEIFGREDEIETIVKAVLGGKPVLVAGGPGMGKTAVATVALYDARIVAAFGRRRIFASLEAATEPRAILAKVVEPLGLPTTGDEAALFRILETAVIERPLAAILDNAETVFDTHRAEAERLLNLVAALKGLSLVVTIRGVPPSVANAVLIDDLPKLDANAARKAFLAIAGSAFVTDADLTSLLEILDGHALSIRLVAAQATGLPALAGLRESWDEAHAEILRRPGETESRLTSVRVSLLLSLNSGRIKTTPLARRLLALLAYLPGGLNESVVSSLLGDRGAVSKVKANEAVSCLHQLRLIEQRPDRRLRMLTPLRECVRIDLSVMEPDRKRLVTHYLSLATKGEQIGRREWQRVHIEVEAEADNLDPVCRFAVEANINDKRLADALWGLGEFQHFSGRGTFQSIELAARRLRFRPASRLTATCNYALGKIACVRGRYETARIQFEEALRLYRATKDVQGAAHCIRRLGDIAFGRSDHKTALALYEEALSLYQANDNLLGEANCIQDVGSIASARSDYGMAGTYYHRALVIFRKLSEVGGEANCLIYLARMALQRRDYEAAKTYYDEALEFCRRVGGVQGQAFCMTGYGDIARERFQHGAAQAHYHEALMLFQGLGDVFGEAETIINQGRVRRAIGENTRANNDINTGFALYFGLADPENRALPGWQAMHRALTCDDAAEVAKHREVARSSWTAIGRLDLVREWVDGPQ